MSSAEQFSDKNRIAWKRLAAIGIALVALAIATYGVLRAEFGDRPALINVRWAPSVSAASQSALEAKYHLASGRQAEGRTYGYQLTDLSYDNIRAMVLDPAVEDTHYIHRTAYRIWRFAPRARYPGRGAVLGPILEMAVVLFALIAGTAFLLAFLELVLPKRLSARLPLRHTFLHPRSTAAAVLRGIGHRIPPATAEQAALFRIVFGSALLLLFLAQRVGGASVLEVSNALTPLHEALIAPFTAAPWLVSWVLPWLMVWGVMLVAGAVVPLSYAMLTIGAVLWAALLTTRVSYHTVSALLVCLVCLGASRWADAWSVDAWWRQRRGQSARAPASPTEYGYTIWIPGVVAGVVFAAAAVAKLRESGLGWIVNGTIKYHFLSDARQAPVDWGLRIGLHPQLAVALSFGAVLVESLIIFGAFARTYRYRAMAGAGAASLLAGFALFQGLFWPAWWLLLISFLPWHRMARQSPAPSARRSAAPGGWLVPLQTLIVVALIVEQVVVSGLKLEAGPAFSTYGMYSNSYASPSEYEAQSATSYWLVSDDGRQCKVTEQDANASLSGGDLVQRCFGAVDPSRVEVEQRRAKIDWTSWRPAGEVRTVLRSASAGSAAR